MKNFFKHLGVILKHKHLVLLHTYKLGILHLGLIHDLSKFHAMNLKIALNILVALSPLLLIKDKMKVYILLFLLIIQTIINTTMNIGLVNLKVILF